MHMTCSPKDYDTLKSWMDAGYGVTRLGLGDYVRAESREETRELIRLAVKIARPA